MDTKFTLKSDTLLHYGKYRIVRIIGQGGFGCTYEAVHVMLGRRVAIKELFISDFCSRNEDEKTVTYSLGKQAFFNKFQSKFIDEAKTLCTLKHDNIVRVSDVFQENGTAYYVMDFIDGPSLQSVIELKGSISEDTALKYIKEIATALDYLHAHQLLHLDIKPGNIIINQDDRAILIDFGASKIITENVRDKSSTVTCQTPGYAPIELISGQFNHFTPASDIYSLGATLYKLITGVTPISSAIRASGEILEMPSDISNQTYKLVEKAMSLDTKERYQSMNEFKNDIKQIDIKRVNTVNKKSKRIHYVVALSLALILISFGIIFFFHKPRDPRPIDCSGIDEIIDLAKSGDADAQNRYAEFLYSKDSISNIEQAIELWQSSVIKGNAKAMYNLGVCYLYGQGCKVDKRKAFELFKKSSEAGEDDATFNLALCYADGIGVKQDHDRAIELLELLNAKSYPDADTLLAELNKMNNK